MNGKIKALDVCIIVAVIAVAVASAFSIYGNRSAEVRLVIESPSGQWLYGLDTDRTVEIEGEIGVTVVDIHDGAAHVADSACENKTCVSSPAISRQGEWIACLPNKVMLRIDGSDASGDGIDAVVR
jgi:hypothetical protein